MTFFHNFHFYYFFKHTFLGGKERSRYNKPNCGLPVLHIWLKVQVSGEEFWEFWSMGFTQHAWLDYAVI